MLQRAAHNIGISKQDLIVCFQVSDVFRLISRKTPGQTFFFCT
jgi:hypothetical protein